jgi:hypothetical protein
MAWRRSWTPRSAVLPRSEALYPHLREQDSPVDLQDGAPPRMGRHTLPPKGRLPAMPLHLITRDQFTSKQAVYVGASQMAVTRETPLTNQGASNCMIIIFHVDGVGGALTHILPDDDDRPAMEKMMASLTKLGAKANQVEVLIGGAVGREGDPNWRQNFINKLTQLGIQLGNVIDARTSTDKYSKTPINRDAPGLRNVAYDPKAAQALPLQLLETHTANQKASDVKVYAIANRTGAISSTASDGQCIVI